MWVYRLTSRGALRRGFFMGVHLYIDSREVAMHMFVGFILYLAWFEMFFGKPAAEQEQRRALSSFGYAPTSTL